MEAAVKLNLKSGTKYLQLTIHEYRQGQPVFRLPAEGQSWRLLTADQIRKNWNAWVRDECTGDYAPVASTSLQVF